LSTTGNKPDQIVAGDLEGLSKPHILHIASELEKLSGLLEQGLLTGSEFQELKKRLIDGKSASSNSS